MFVLRRQRARRSRASPRHLVRVSRTPRPCLPSRVRKGDSLRARTSRHADCGFESRRALLWARGRMVRHQSEELASVTSEQVLCTGPARALTKRVIRTHARSSAPSRTSRLVRGRARARAPSVSRARRSAAALSSRGPSRQRPPARPSPAPLRRPRGPHAARVSAPHGAPTPRETATLLASAARRAVDTRRKRSSEGVLSSRRASVHTSARAALTRFGTTA